VKTWRFSNQFNQGLPRQTPLGEFFMPEWDSPDSGDVSLDNSSSEENRAIANMVHKSREDCADMLLVLDRRIGFLMHDPNLEQWQNPLCPEAICTAFHGAATLFETGLEIRLLIFRLFDQYVISNMDELYKDLNQYLAKTGVMPDVKSTLTSDAAPADGPQTAIPQLSKQSGVGADKVAAMASAPSRTVTSAPAATGQQAGADRRAPAQSGDMTIDVVAMLFDFILDDKNIPLSMRALLGRLQIPLVKVAMLEREFFSKKSHPARQLLNALAATAMGWDAQQGHEDPSYRKVETIVQTIVDEFETDTSLFKTLLDDLQSFLSAEQQQTRIRAERSVKVMQGQERLEAAKATTMQEIEPHISGQNNLEFVHEFVSTHWKHLLTITCVRQGKGSDTWKQVVSTMDDLIWSVKPKNTNQERRRLAAMQPQLLNQLREGMQRLSVPSTEADAFISRLVDAHGRTLISKEHAEQAAETQSHSVEMDDPYTAKVRQLTNGTWMEFLDSNGKAAHAKLSWISPINNSYLFTDRQGQKAASYSLEELANLMRSAAANVINAEPPMDGAVSSVIEDDQEQ